MQAFGTELFDLLVIGGGITGAGVARDAALRGLKVALVEREDFSYGTSSRSSKLIHGGLRYLENFELRLVFEALNERTLLLRTMPHMVRPLTFYWPIYANALRGKFLLGCGLWLYDLLSFFRAPGFHRQLSTRQMLKELPFLKSAGLRGGFRYADASMVDDLMVVETLRSATLDGQAEVANYVEAISPIWSGDRVWGFRVRDRLTNETISLRAQQTVVCAGPWTDEVARSLSADWRSWLKPSKGAHLIFALQRLPLPGAVVMSHPEDGRIAFVIPRPDLGDGIVIVGTTDGPAPSDAQDLEVAGEDVRYLMTLLQGHFPELHLTHKDIIGAYVGVRPLMGDNPGQGGGPDRDQPHAAVLQKISREHHIDYGPGRTIVVAGGKYTTHRTMAREIVDFALRGQPPRRKCRTHEPVNPDALEPAVLQARKILGPQADVIPLRLWERYGARAAAVWQMRRDDDWKLMVPAPTPGFPELAAQLRYCIQHEMVIHLADFFLRRVPLFLARADGGAVYIDPLSQVWAEELGASLEAAAEEASRLRSEITARQKWRRLIA